MQMLIQHTRTLIAASEHTLILNAIVVHAFQLHQHLLLLNREREIMRESDRERVQDVHY